MVGTSGICDWNTCDLVECAPASLALDGMNIFIPPSGWGTVGVGKRTPQCVNIIDTIILFLSRWLSIAHYMILAQRCFQFLVTFLFIFFLVFFLDSIKHIIKKK